ncbi:hypothetical protein QYM36_010169 [Artemia franciscana]|nr:hypothetical protein QYM36_010169 [Artemia franciscana]
MSGRTPLHELITEWKEEEKSFSRCFNELVNHPKIDINIEDDDEATPLELAVERGLENIAKKLLNLGATVTDTARALINNTYPHLLRCDLGLEQFNNNTQLSETELAADLMKNIRNNNSDQCRQIIELAANSNINLDLNKGVSDGATFLQTACEIGLPEIVDLLVSTGASTETTSSALDKKPIILACGTGSDKIIQTLLSNGANVNHICPDTRQTLLHEIAQQLSKNPKKYLQCLRTLLAYRNEEFQINAQDNSGNTPLHYAVANGCEEAVLLLLRNGADIAIKNVCGNTPLQRIHPHILKAFLDECITPGNKSSPGASNFILTYNYSFLSSSAASAVASPAPSEGADMIVIAESRKTSKNSEIDILREIAVTPRLQPLLRHPVVRSFVAFKWHKISWAFWLNCSLFFAMIALLTGYVLVLKHETHGMGGNLTSATFQRNEDIENDGAVRVLLGVALSVFAAGLFLRELFQMSIDFDRYIHSFENYVEILLIFSVSAMLLAGSNAKIAINFAAIAIILAWFELLLLVGRYPRLSTYVAAFVTVLKTFTIMLIGYSILIIGFALSFFVLGAFDDESDVSTAQGISRSILRCYVMMTGELDYQGLEFDEKPIVTKGVFLFFIFLVTIILINLLNALAVSDTQMIKNKAEIVIYASHIEMISYFESMFLRRPFQNLRRRYPSFIKCFNRFYQPIQQILNPSRVSVFSKCLPFQRYTVYPNRNPKSKLSDDVLHCNCHSDYRIDAEILNESLDLLKDTSVAEQRTRTEVEERLQNLELMLQDLIKMKVKM